MELLASNYPQDITTLTTILSGWCMPC